MRCGSEIVILTDSIVQKKIEPADLQALFFGILRALSLDDSIIRADTCTSAATNA